MEKKTEKEQIKNNLQKQKKQINEKKVKQKNKYTKKPQ